MSSVLEAVDTVVINDIHLQAVPPIDNLLVIAA